MPAIIKTTMTTISFDQRRELTKKEDLKVAWHCTETSRWVLRCPALCTNDKKIKAYSKINVR